MAKHEGLMCLQCHRPLVEVVTRDQLDGDGRLIGTMFVSAKCTGGTCFGRVWNRRKRPE